ncbi:SRPBCC family protein [Nocardioidaceae bacterium]|nr:SRPBCC family protein [Nocardioidaceae bacterium]
MTHADVTTVDAGPQKVARSIEVAAPPSQIFALVANPHRHHELDGSGTVKDKVSGPERLTEGDSFTVSMKQFGLPYKIKSRAVEVSEEPGHAVVAWKHPMGHTWRWEMQQVGEGRTQVTETFDYSTALVPKALELAGFPKKNGEGIASTLRNLARRFS